MPREMPRYRLELESLREFFPGQQVVNRRELMAYLGRSYKWLDSHGLKGKQNFTLVEVADFMSRL